MTETRYPLQIGGGLFLLSTGTGLCAGALFTRTLGGYFYIGAFLASAAIGILGMVVTRRGAAARSGRPTRAQVGVAIVTFLGQFAAVVAVISWAVAAHWSSRSGTVVVILEIVAIYFLTMRLLFGPWILWLGTALTIWLGLAIVLRLPPMIIAFNDGLLKAAFGLCMAAPLFRPPPPVSLDVPPRAVKEAKKIDWSALLDNPPLVIRSGWRSFRNTSPRALLGILLIVGLFVFSLAFVIFDHPGHGRSLREQRMFADALICVLLFGSLLVLGIWSHRRMRLVLDRGGVAYRSGFREVYHPWSDFDRFEEITRMAVRQQSIPVSLVGCVYSSSCPIERRYPPIRRDGKASLSDWDMHTPDLVNLLNAARERWTSSERQASDGTLANARSGLDRN